MGDGYCAGCAAQSQNAGYDGGLEHHVERMLEEKRLLRNEWNIVWCRNLFLQQWTEVKYSSQTAPFL